MKTIDLNGDVGETPGNQPGSPDEALLTQVSSANIACGFHAGDPQRMEATVAAAMRQGVAIGAHPGLQDLAGLGRVKQAINPAEAYRITLYQIGALHAFVTAAGGRLHHVKPHGALYNMAARDAALAAALASAVHDFDPTLVLYGLAGSELVKAGQAKGLRVAAEGFPDRHYEVDGTLTPRTSPYALITNLQIAINQAIIFSSRVDTLCIHSDGPHALGFATAIRQALEQAGFTIQPCLF
ncbi:LamB/YcsF family protein [Parapedobacter sp. DT-150]|uniref:LamB/YcsF family protein n=1 Tax=Parapedobacter sp. DT-150 TaxID=3396162 RepID=UPI003F1B03DE